MSVTRKIVIQKILICHCQKCGIVEKIVWDKLDDFRKHSNAELSGRCLEKGQYAEAGAGISCSRGIDDVSFYVMGPK
jgi:hypothetical protein